MPVMTAAEARAQAIALAGSDDFGGPGIDEGLERCLAAFATLPLTEPARDAAMRGVVHSLATRLRIEAWTKGNPEAAAHPVENSVFVIGMPRTGTTATVAMLALNPRLRFLRAWEGASPLPPPIAGEEDLDPRVIAARAAAAAYDKPHIHLHDPDGPEEDLVFLAGYDMRGYHGAYPMPDDYIDWWIAEDFRAFYALHERMLRLLHAHRPPRRWLLKSPVALFKLAAIAERYPTARFVMTHRDPARLIPSVASLHHTLHAERCLPGSLDKATLGPRLLAFWAEGMRRALAARATIGEDRFLDVRNADIVAEPLPQFERIQAFLGLDVDAALRQRLTDYAARNAPGAFGQHRYTAAEFGLAEAQISETFADYKARFGV